MGGKREGEGEGGGIRGARKSAAGVVRRVDGKMGIQEERKKKPATARGKRSEKGERRRRKGWPAVARRSVEVAGAERGEFQRRDVSTGFQSKKRHEEVRDEAHVLSVGKLHRILGPLRECLRISVFELYLPSPSPPPLQAAPFRSNISPDLPSPLSFRLEVDFHGAREENRS